MARDKDKKGRVEIVTTSEPKYVIGLMFRDGRRERVYKCVDHIVGHGRLLIAFEKVEQWYVTSEGDRTLRNITPECRQPVRVTRAIGYPLDVIEFYEIQPLPEE